MTPEELAFRAALKANPADATARLVFADWLEEHARPVDAALQRVLGQPDDDGRRLEYADAVGGERGEFVRVQVEIAKVDPHIIETADYIISRGSDAHDSCPEWVNAVRLRRRERDIPPGCLDAEVAQLVACNVRPSWRRGFVDEVRCAAADWLSHADAIREQQPVRKVRLTTLPDFRIVFRPDRERRDETTGDRVLTFSALVGWDRRPPMKFENSVALSDDDAAHEAIIRTLGRERLRSNVTACAWMGGTDSWWPGIEFEPPPGGFLVPEEFAPFLAVPPPDIVINTYS